MRYVMVIIVALAVGAPAAAGESGTRLKEVAALEAAGGRVRRPAERRRDAAGPRLGAAARLRPRRGPGQDGRQEADDLFGADAGQHARAVRRVGARGADEDKEHRR